MTARSKACRQCGDVLLLDDFYVHPMMRDGHLNKCKKCIQSNVRRYALANPEKVRLLGRRFARLPKYRQKDKSWREKNPEAVKVIRTRWEVRNPEKRKAEWTIGNALRDGKIIKPSACQKCLAVTKIEAHHPDYSKPFEVEWLCLTCHGETRHKS